MQELIQKVSASVGIPEDKAKMAVEVILAQLKAKLPAPLASQVESALAGDQGGGVGEKVAGLAGKLSG